MLQPTSHLHPFTKLFAYFPVASHLLWVSDCFYMLQGWDFTKDPCWPLAFSKCDESWCEEGNALWHNSWSMLAIYILQLNTFWLKTLVKLQVQNIIWLWRSLWYAIALVVYCLFLAGKWAGSTIHGHDNFTSSQVKIDLINFFNTLKCMETCFNLKK